MTKKRALPDWHFEKPDLRAGLKPSGGAGKPDWRRRAAAWTLTLAAHLTVFAALFSSRTAPPPVEPAPLQLSMIDVARPPAPPEPAKRNTASRARTVPTKTPRPVTPAPATEAPTPDTSDVMNDSDIAGAASAGDGAGGGRCDTARLLQQALQRDPLVHTAVENAHRLGKAIMLWNGDWVRSGEEDGKGLSAVREAIVWQMAFAPEACRNEQMHGLVLLSLADGSTRFAIGAGNWRWSDLLFVHGSQVR